MMETDILEVRNNIKSAIEALKSLAN
jgi:hypothetical protein